MAKKTVVFRGKLNAPASSAKKVANKALREVNKLKQATEVKTVDNSDSAACSSAWALLGSDYLNVAEGDTHITRDGIEVKSLSLHFRGNLTASVTSQVSHQARIVIYWSPDDTALTLPAPMESNSTLSFKALLVRKGVRILYDRTFNVGPTHDGVSPIAGSTFKSFEKFVRFPKMLKYGGATASRPINGFVAAMIIADSGATPPTFNLFTRWRFTG